MIKFRLKSKNKKSLTIKAYVKKKIIMEIPGFYICVFV